jgi:hypothetical protein
MRRWLPLLAVLLLLPAPAMAKKKIARKASGGPGSTLRYLAAHQIHGWQDRDIPLDELQRRVESGGRISVPCGVVTTLGEKMLKERGYNARYTLAAAQRGRFDDEHAMLEVKHKGRWGLWDVDGNAKAAIPKGGGAPSLTRIIAAKPKQRRWKPIANDPIYDPTNSPVPQAEARIYGNYKKWKNKVLTGTPAVRSPSGDMVFNDRSMRKRLGGYGYRRVGDRRWAKLNK